MSEEFLWVAFLWLLWRWRMNHPLRFVGILSRMKPTVGRILCCNFCSTTLRTSNIAGTRTMKKMSWNCISYLKHVPSSPKWAIVDCWLVPLSKKNKTFHWGDLNISPLAPLILTWQYNGNPSSAKGNDICIQASIFSASYVFCPRIFGPMAVVGCWVYSIDPTWIHDDSPVFIGVFIPVSRFHPVPHPILGYFEVALLAGRSHLEKVWWWEPRKLGETPNKKSRPTYIRTPQIIKAIQLHRIMHQDFVLLEQMDSNFWWWVRRLIRNMFIRNMFAPKFLAIVGGLHFFGLIFTSTSGFILST